MLISFSPLPQTNEARLHNTTRGRRDFYKDSPKWRHLPNWVVCQEVSQRLVSSYFNEYMMTTSKKKKKHMSLNLDMCWPCSFVSPVLFNHSTGRNKEACRE